MRCPDWRGWDGPGRGAGSFANGRHRRPRRRRLALLFLGLCFVVADMPAARSYDLLRGGDDQQVSSSASDWGVTGLMQMPNARIAPDGEARFTSSFVWPYQRFNLDLAALPGLETAFRYTNIVDEYYGPFYFSGTQKYKDRSFDLKAQLLEEGAYLPAVALTLRDFAGTGLFSGEFLTASRRFYDLDFSWGLAWGYGGDSGHFPNPVGWVFKSFNSRKAANPVAGGFSIDYFHGPTSLYGGVEYITPVPGLRFKMEYDGNDYAEDPLGNNLPERLPINLGVQYAILPFADLTLGYERGNTAMFSITLHDNFNSDKGLPQADVPPSTAIYGPEPEPQEESTEPGATAPQPAPVPQARGSEPPVPASDRSALDRLLNEYGLIVRSRGPGETAMTIEIDADRPIPDRERLAAIAESLGGLQPGLTVEEIDVTALSGGRVVATMPLVLAKLRRGRGLVGDPCALEHDACAWRAAPGADPLIIARLAGSDAQPAAVPSPAPRRVPPLSARERRRLAQAIHDDLGKQGIAGISVAFSGNAATLRFADGKYRDPVIAIGRAARVLAHDTPPRIQLFNLVLYEGGVPALEIGLIRKDVEGLAAGTLSPAELWSDTQITAAPSASVDTDAESVAGSYPKFSAGLAPATRQQIGGPNGFLFFQAYLDLDGSMEIMPGWVASGDVGKNLYNNTNNITLQSDSVLPHVRSDIVNYLQGHDQWLNDLYTNYAVRLAPDLYAQATAGYYEPMFAGAGGEILWRPHDATWAIGADADHLRQRAFNDYFGFLPYEVTTGFINLYDKIPGPDLLVEVSLGRYLARDRGATLDISREFGNGIRVGIFATKTNVSAAQFGEGSFDKGFYVSIPMDLFTGAPTTASAGYTFRPTTRDGGQRVDHPVDLYGTLRDSDDTTISEHWPNLAR